MIRCSNRYLLDNSADRDKAVRGTKADDEKPSRPSIHGSPSKSMTIRWGRCRETSWDTTLESVLEHPSSAETSCNPGSPHETRLRSPRGSARTSEEA